MLSRRLLRVAFVAMVALAFIGLASAQEGSSDLSLDMEDMSLEEETNFLELDTLAEPATHALVEAKTAVAATAETGATAERRHHHRHHWHRPHHHHHHRPHHHHHHRHHGHHHHRHHGHHRHHHHGRHHGHRWWRWGWGHRHHRHHGHHHRHHHHHRRHHHHGHHRHHWWRGGHRHHHHRHHGHHHHRHHHHGGHGGQPAAQHSSQPAAQHSSQPAAQHSSQPAAQQSQQSHSGSSQPAHSSSGSGSSGSSSSGSSNSGSSSSHHEERKESKPQRPAFDPASRHASGRIDLSPTGYKNSYITDWGYAHDRQWVDVREAGVRNDYGRWVGNHPSVWFSIALYDCPNQYSGRGEWILENGAVKRGPNYKGHECKQRPAVTRSWQPAPSAPFRAPPAKQAYFPDLKSAHASASQNQVAKLSCPAGQKINVKDATFGAGAGVYQASGYIVKGSCHFKGSHQHAVETCNNKDHCELKPTDAEFGSDPCPSNGNKELTVVYSCVTFTAPSSATTPAAIQTSYQGIKLALFNQDQEAFLSCPGSKQLNILDAAFGQKQGFYESNGFIVKGKCNAANSAKVVADNCHGKSDCKFQVDASKLPTGDDCNSSPKTLKITYRCAAAEASKPFATVAFPAPRQWAYKKTAPLAVTPQPQDARAASVSGGGNGVVKIGNSEVHIHVTQLSAPEPNAKALNYVEEKLDRLHETAMNKIDGLLDDIETRRKAKKPCLKKLQRTINKFKQAFVSESSNIERITHKYSYADDAPTLV